jgi:hypothetical protein
MKTKNYAQRIDGQAEAAQSAGRWRDRLSRTAQAGRVAAGLDEVPEYATPRGFPHDFLASNDFIFGDMSGQLDLPPGRSAHG